jgi:magnesium-transporting ATPase (P-type)
MNNLSHDRSVQDEPTAAFGLSLAGGIIGLLVGFVLIAIGAIIYNNNYNIYCYYYYDYTTSLFLGIGIWTIITSIVVIISAGMLHSNPWAHTRWGVLILVFSIIGLGWWLLGVIGGILALVYKPQAPIPPQPPMQAVTRICPQCGRVMSEDVKFCPHCGKELG